MNQALESTIRKIKPLDQAAMDAVRVHQDILTKPHGSLGKLEALSISIAGMQGNPKPGMTHKAIITMAADHGVVAEGVTLYPQEVTKQMVLNFLVGGAGINVLARLVGARVVVVNMGVNGHFDSNPDLIDNPIDLGTKNMAKGPAMTREQVINSIAAGIKIVESETAKGLDIVGTGDMGLGNTTPSSAICALITKNPVASVTGRGTGLGDQQLAHKVNIIEQALKVNQPDPDDPIDILSKVGGFEIGGLVGVMLGAAANRIPVVIDGFISTAAALLAAEISPAVREYFISSHLSVESGHRAALAHLGLESLLDLEMRLGEGTGAALAMNIIEASIKILNEMATFANAGVSEADEKAA